MADGWSSMAINHRSSQLPSRKWAHTPLGGKAWRRLWPTGGAAGGPTTLASPLLSFCLITLLTGVAVITLVDDVASFNNITCYAELIFDRRIIATKDQASPLWKNTKANELMKTDIRYNFEWKKKALNTILDETFFIRYKKFNCLIFFVFRYIWSHQLTKCWYKYITNKIFIGLKMA